MPNAQSAMGWILTILLVLGMARQGHTDEVLLLQGTTPRLTFDDNVAPTWKWEIEVGSGGFQVFQKADSGDTLPFKISPFADHHSLVVAADRKVGFGTFDPQRSLHIVDDTAPPSIRFENTSATWDIEADDLGFSVVDVSAARTPLHILTNGRVGIGTTNPVAGQLQVTKVAQAGAAETLARFNTSDSGVAWLDINNVSSTDGVFHPRVHGLTPSLAVPLTLEGTISTDSGVNPVITLATTKVGGGPIVTRPLFTVRNNVTTRLRLAANGDLFATSFAPISSRTLKDNIVDLDSSKAAEALKELTPVEYVYKDDPEAEKRVGFIAEDVPEIVANADRQSVPIMDVVALVTKVVKDQQQTIDDQKKTIDGQQKSIDILSKRLLALETRMQDKE